jgi:4-hydroxy-tetrahydrodipicolinate synthase
MITGSLVAIVTPMHEDGSLDLESFRKLIDWHVAEGSDGIVVVGTTGESPTVDFDEHKELIRVAVEHAKGRIPIVAGTGGNSTAEAIELTESAKKAGATACLSVVPYYNKPTQEGIYQHYTALADAIDKPLLMYNVPGRTVADMLPETVERLARHDNIFGLKEATGDIERLKQIQAVVGDDFALYSGDDFTLRPFIEQGGHGVVTVSGNVAPRQVASLCELAMAGKADEAKALDETLQPLNTALFIESNPIPVKWAVSAMGLMEPHIRLPLTPYSDRYHEGMRSAMRTAGVDLEENA